MINQTKKLIQTTLIDLCQAISFEKITIKDICNQAQISRQTFYNHFMDKYEVVSSIYSQDTNSNNVNEIEITKRSFTNNLNNLWEKRTFYRNVLSSGGQNSLYEFARKQAENLSKEYVFRHTKTALSLEQNYQIIYFSYGYVGCIFEWIIGNLNYTPEELADIEINSFPDFMVNIAKR